MIAWSFCNKRSRCPRGVQYCSNPPTPALTSLTPNPIPRLWSGSVLTQCTVIVCHPPHWLQSITTSITRQTLPTTNSTPTSTTFITLTNGYRLSKDWYRHLRSRSSHRTRSVDYFSFHFLHIHISKDLRHYHLSRSSLLLFTELYEHDPRSPEEMLSQAQSNAHQARTLLTR